MKYIIATLLVLYSSVASADIEPVLISPKYCKGGPHLQPSGLFAIYIFCDDALGTNIAVYLNKLGAPLREKYDLGKRFWQGEKWSYDVTSYAWLNDENHLLVATSAIYGSGSLYLLDLENQKSKVLFHTDGIIEIKKISGSEVTLHTEDVNGKTKTIKSKCNKAVHPTITAGFFFLNSVVIFNNNVLINFVAVRR